MEYGVIIKDIPLPLSYRIDLSKLDKGDSFRLPKHGMNKYAIQELMENAAHNGATLIMVEEEEATLFQCIHKIKQDESRDEKVLQLIADRPQGIRLSDIKRMTHGIKTRDLIDILNRMEAADRVSTRQSTGVGRSSKIYTLLIKEIKNEQPL